jgi:hypothetical protein
MALIMPPDVPAICEPASAPMIVCNAVAMEFRKGEAVWIHLLTKHCLGDMGKEFRREAVLCFTMSDFIACRDWVVGLGEGPRPTGNNIVLLKAH